MRLAPYCVIARIWWCCVLIALSGGVGAASPWSELEKELQRRDYPAAWAAAERLAPDHAGEPDFDFLYALAALETGHPQHAAFALERILLVRPDQHRARVELARAYFLLGDHAGARREFLAVRNAGPPSNVRSRIELFLAEIERRESALRTQVAGYVELRPGWDSNVGSATADSSIEIPALGIVNLGDGEISDRYLDKNAGVTVVHPLSRRRALFADFAYRDRENVDTQAYDTRSVGLSTGLAWNGEGQRLRLPLQYQVLYLANEEFRRLASLGIEWTRDMNAGNQLLLFGQLGTLRYPEDGLRDVDLVLAGAGWNHRYAGLPLLASASAYIGDESARRAAGDPNGRLYYGARLGAQWSGIRRHTPYVSLAWQRSDYDADNPVFLRTRSEEFAELRLGWSWQPQRRWNVTAEASLVDNQANISLYEYTRHQFSVGVRYQFN